MAVIGTGLCRKYCTVGHFSFLKVTTDSSSYDPPDLLFRLVLLGGVGLAPAPVTCCQNKVFPNKK